MKLPKFRRFNYDKGHRCPSWSGGGLRSTFYDTKPDNWDVDFHEDYHVPFENSGSRRRHWWQQRDLPCNQGSIWNSRIPGDPWWSWRWGRCSGCDLILIPRVTRYLDWTWWYGMALRDFGWKFRDLWYIWMNRKRWDIRRELRVWWRLVVTGWFRHKAEWFGDLYRWYRYPEIHRAEVAELKEHYGVK